MLRATSTSCGGKRGGPAALQSNKLSSPMYSSCSSTMSEIIQIINARLVEGNSLVSRSLWIDSLAGIFVPSPDPALVKVKGVSTIDLQGRILSPGFIDLQINGAYGFDFSEDASKDAAGVSYKNRYSETRQKLIKTGTTSFLPTMTSQHAERYHQVSI